MSLELAHQIWSRRNRKRCPVSQAPDQWTGDFALPSPIIDYYQQIGPDDLYCYDRTHLNLYLPSLRKLKDFQNGILNAPEPSDTDLAADQWGPHQLAVAIHHTYPFIFNADSGSVAFSMPGLSRGDGWRTVAVLKDLAEMMIFFGLLEKAIESGDDLFDDEGEQSTEFTTILTAAASRHIDQTLASTLVQNMFG